MKHAYMIMAHTNMQQLKMLVDMLDNPRNDIFIHIDSKFSLDKNFSIESKFSEITILKKRINVRWGHSSQILCELELLKKATEKEYLYYHLISGMDLPIKSQKYIHEFFDKQFQQNNEQQFIKFDEKKDFSNRIKYYFLFNNMYIRKKNIKLYEKVFNKILTIINQMSLGLQKILGINRLKKNDITIVGKGSNWFSITEDFANYILQNEELIKRMIKFSDCCDEIIIQTLFLKKYKVNDLDKYNNFRLIDWERGRPYTFTDNDYDMLMNTECLFARKFDERIDKKIIERIYSELCERDNYGEN